MALNGGNPVPLYSPSSWEDGSSGSHTDDQYYFDQLNQNLLMGAQTPPGPAARTMTNFERGMLMDYGFSVVPEPSSTLLIVLGTFGFVLRRRRV